MFTELAELVKTTNLHIQISASGDNELKVIVLPKPKEGTNPALCQPLALTATPEELDEKFAGILTSYKATRRSLEETLEETKAYMEAAGKAEREKAAQAAKQPASADPAKTAAPEAGETSDAGQDDDFDLLS